jgi:hypothetical protein
MAPRLTGDRSRREDDMNTRAVRAQVRALVRGPSYMAFDDMVARFPPKQINTRLPNVPYTPWPLLEHMRLAQRDILDYIREPDYREPNWPDDYWPGRDATADMAAWRKTLAAFRHDRAALDKIVANSRWDLSARLPYGRPHTLLRELLIVAEHNTYHIGEFAILRQVMNTWPPGHR